MVAAACPMATAVQVLPVADEPVLAVGQLGGLDPQHPGGRVRCLGECLGVIDG
jgi:hypothetical protein